MKNITKILIIIFLLLLILFKAYVFSNKYKEDRYISNTYVYIESLKSVTETSVKYIARLGEERENIKFKDKFILKIYNTNNEIAKEKWKEYIGYTNGDVIKINGKIQIPELMNNPGEFKYKYYLYSNNIYGEIAVNKIIERVKYKLNLKEKALNYIYKYKEYLGKKLDENMDTKYSSVAKSIIYGDTIDILDSTKEDFEKAGVSHMMAISGSNIIGLITVIVFVFNLFKVNNKLSKALSSIIVLAYVVLTGASLSTLRAGIMCIICTIKGIINEDSGKNSSSFKNLIYTTLIILFHAPFSIYNTGFILSFLATLGIILFNPYCIDFKNKILNRVSNKILKYILDMLLGNLAITLIVQMVILPVQINSFNYISLTAMLSNIFCSLISSVITVLGSMYLFLAYIPIVSNILIFLINIVAGILTFFVDIFSKFSLRINVMDLNILSILAYYIFIFLVYLSLYLKRVFKDRKLNLKKYTFLETTFLMLFILTIIFSNIYFKYLSSFVCFFNVGQGEMSVVKVGENMLIVDIGSLKTTLAFNTISSYFKMNNITEVDGVILSHMHSDHINGLENFVKEYKVKEIIYAKPFYENEEYIKFLEIVEEYNLNVVEVKKGDVLRYGDIIVEVLLPDNEEIIEKNDGNNINANSLVIKVSVKDKDVLYMGDATKETEEKLLKIYENNNGMFKDIEILKVGHHGSKTSTSEEYIEKIKPKYSVISAKKKYYNHPHESVIKILKTYNSGIYITENIGCIKFNLYNL